MARFRIHRFAVAALSIVLAAHAEAPLAKKSGLKLRMIAGRPVVDNVFLNGNGPYLFLLDTGGETNQVDVNLARKLGLGAAFQVELVTSAGVRRVPGGKVERVSLGPSEASGQEFLFASLDGVHELSSDISGILGQEFLAHFDYTLDFRNRQLVFDEAPPDWDRVPVRVLHQRMLVPTNQGELVLDSGTAVLTLFREASTPRAATILGSSGLAAMVSVGLAPDLIIAGHRYRPANAAFGLSSPGAEGLLPASLLQAVFISNAERYVALEPKRGDRR